MKLADFKSLLTLDTPPEGISVPLLALWYDARGDWEKAHQLAQDDSSKEAAWVHAYLHRKEGDNTNARYWYAQARKRNSVDTLESEWEHIVTELLRLNNHSSQTKDTEND